MPKSANIPANQRCQPITPPIIRRNIKKSQFLPESVCRGLRLQNTRKNARRHHPTWREPNKMRSLKGRHHLVQIDHCPYGSAEATQARGRPSFPAHSAGRKNLRRTKCAAEVLSCPRTRRKGRSPSGGQLRQLTRRCNPVVLILDSTGLDTSQGLAELLITGPISV